MMNLSDRYPVYSANSSRCLRWMLILLVLICFCVSAVTGFVWLYGVSVVTSQRHHHGGLAAAVYSVGLRGAGGSPAVVAYSQGESCRLSDKACP